METEKTTKTYIYSIRQQMIIGAVNDFFSKLLIYWNKKKF